MQESLHGREILAACALTNKGKRLIITGSEDTYVKASEFNGTELRTIQTFSNHVASVRALCKVKIIDPKSPSLQHILVSAGSRLEANVYRIKRSTGFQMGHICHFMRSFEQNANDQDLRIMSVCAFQLQLSLDMIFAVFGTSSGEIEFHRINLHKKRLELVKDCTLRARGSVLCMRKLKFKDSVVLVVGLSSGDIVLAEVQSKDG